MGKVIPKLNRKFPGLAFHVPTSNVSIVDLTRHLEKAAKYDVIKKVVKRESQGPLKSILEETKDQVGTCNFNIDSHSSNFDVGAGIALRNNSVKFISWYDNEYGYSNRWRTSWPAWPPRSKEHWAIHSNKDMRAKERPLVVEESLSQLSPNTELLGYSFHIRSQKNGDLGSPTLLNIIDKVH